ncbi:hypothetical protein SAMN05444920_105245 [Nonomuraea solani]|uniref:Uncharacterized protein n=1 Tax=Nonomuraea solani TaxID=1144553 RepID=A0A1H6DEI7_9ACTN|nr:hypothetical protein SAMN05444920_105245 [Nonomuraea solani]
MSMLNSRRATAKGQRGEGAQRPAPSSKANAKRTPSAPAPSARPSKISAKRLPSTPRRPTVRDQNEENAQHPDRPPKDNAMRTLNTLPTDRAKAVS